MAELDGSTGLSAALAPLAKTSPRNIDTTTRQDRFQARTCKL
jgi:hypothetical protein